MGTFLHPAGRLMALAAVFWSSTWIAEAACPTYVEIPSGTVFDIGRMVADSGSPAAALAKARADVAQVESYGGCSTMQHSPRYQIC